MTLSAGTHLGPYEILAQLGAGGMGEVYRARDKKLDRDVAIKVLPQSVAADPDTLARFEREAKAVAALSHPNILSIFDFGTQDGIAYAVMELLEGETLRAKLDTGPIPQKQAVDYALQVAKGLSAAHEKGIVHRDLKPENLFVSKDGHLKILDFGLAKRVEPVAFGKETSAPTVPGHTEPGVVMGTAGYMSPEQVRGLPVDQRSDIFSFGTILYELLSGKRAFRRPTAADTMAAIMKEEPPELSESGRNVSPALDHIVKHCLEKDRDNRFQTAKDIAFNLSEQSSQPVASSVQLAVPPTGKRKALIAAAAIFVLAAAGILLLQRTQRGGGNAGGVKRVAVLPFENVGAPEDDYFADGIADEIRSKLTSLRGVEVIARSSSTPYKKTTKTPKQIAQELDVKYLLTATVRWQKGTGASRVHVTPELVEVRESGAPASTWQEPFDAALTDVFHVQADIASRVAQSLGVALGAGEVKRLVETPTANLIAYDAFLRAEKESGKRRLELLEQAVALDPAFALAWSGVSEMSSFLYQFTPEPELAERARMAAERTMSLAPGRAEAYVALGTYQGFVREDWTRARELFERGLRIEPGNAELLSLRGWADISLGHWDVATADLTRAMHLDPRALRIKLDLGRTLLLTRRYSEAHRVLDEGLALAPAYLSEGLPVSLILHLIRLNAMTYLAEGDLTKARAVIKAAPRGVEPAALVVHLAVYLDLGWVLDDEQRELLLRMAPSAWVSRAVWAINLTDAAALKRDEAGTRVYAEEARKAYQEQLRTAPRDAESHAALGVALAYLGRKEEAMREGRSAVELAPLTKDAFAGAAIRHEVVRVYTLVGEPDKAMDQLELLLKMPYFLSPGWLRIDPNFDPLRKNLRFQKLVAGTS